jgi:site-specific recombinase XerC
MPGSLTLLESAPLPLAAAIDGFWADCHLRGLSPRTIERYRYALEPFRRFAVSQGQPDAASVTAKTVRAFLAEESARVGPRRLNHYREVVDRFYRWLAAEDQVAANPASGVRKEREPRKLVVCTYPRAESAR